MPFDNAVTPLDLGTEDLKRRAELTWALETIEEMEKILAKPENWTKGSFHRERQIKHWLPLLSRTQHQYCLVGAGSKARETFDGEPGGYHTVDMRLMWALHLDYSLACFNDHHNRTHADILQFLADGKAKLQRELIALS